MQDEQRHDQHKRRHNSGDQWGEDVCRQLGHRHHALGDDVPQPRGVLSGEPAYGQLGDMLAQTMTATLQDGDTHIHTGLFHMATPCPADSHA